jgi:outer membrane protein assembly factor BamB
MRGLAGPLSRATAIGVLALSALLMAAGPDASGATRAGTASGGESSWTVYHGDAAGSGVSNSVAAVATSAPAWTSPALDGHLYGEPLVSGGDVYVATEDDTVYALSSATGAVVWSTHVASPVPSSMLPCGDISPSVGITGTPVIDPSRNEIFVVADELVNGVPAHKLVGLSTTSGAIKLDEDVDPPGADPAALLQRTGLTLDAGQVVFGLGGNDGDCATYKGRVVAVDEAGGSPTLFTVDAASGESQGAIWMGGAAPAVDGNGDIWVAAGNGSVYSAGQPYDDSDSALELSSSLQLLQYFAPTTWPQNNARDLDMSMAPALLSDGQVVLAGKSRIVYLLDGTRLGGIGGQEASLDAACSEDIDGGSAVVGTTVYLPCPTGPVAVTVTASPAALTVQWTSRVGGGPPIVAAGLVWTIGLDGTLYGLDPSSGSVRQQVSIGVPANHFSTPSVGDGLLLAPSSDRVVAFQATPTSTPASSTPTSTTSSSSTPTSSTSPTSTTVPRPNGAGASGPGPGGGTSPGEIAGIVVAGVIVLGGGRWILLRRRRRGGGP